MPHPPHLYLLCGYELLPNLSQLLVQVLAQIFLDAGRGLLEPRGRQAQHTHLLPQLLEGNCVLIEDSCCGLSKLVDHVVRGAWEILDLYRELIEQVFVRVQPRRQIRAQCRLDAFNMLDDHLLEGAQLRGNGFLGRGPLDGVAKRFKSIAQFVLPLL